MSLLDDIKAKADANGDGKLSLEDLDGLRNGENGEIIDRLREKAFGSDGKLSMDDLKNFNFDTLKSTTGDLIEDAKKSFGDLFGKK